MYNVYIDMIASFDIGIKNMAYCIFDICNNIPLVVDWDVVNLMTGETIEKKICNQSTKKNKICEKTAKYEFKNNFYCEKHAKMSNFMLPDKSCSPPQLKKLKKEDLIHLANSKFIPIDSDDNKDIILNKINIFLENISLKTIKKDKTKASNIDLITIGKNIKVKFDKIKHMNGLEKVIIENQISPIATRMKTIQGMLAQYFIMKNDNIKIEFLSSSGKLKGFEKQNINENSNYKQHKKDAIYYCRQFLEKPEYSSWNWVLDNDKKDDLADCFLQGIWYLKK